MASTLSLVLFPKAGTFLENKYFDVLDLTEKEDPDHNPDFFREKVLLVAKELNLKIIKFAFFTAGNAVFPAAYLELEPQQENLRPLLIKEFSVRKQPKMY